MIILVLGISGSGKDTQAELLASDYGFAVVSTGQLVRDEIASGSQLGQELDDVVNRGEWVEDQIVYRLLEHRLGQLKGRDVILTGAVREIEQVPLLDNALTNLGDDLDKVILFELPEAEAVRRLSGRRFDPEGKMYHLEFNPPPAGLELEMREDDQPEAIRKRFAEFNQSITPIVQEYEKRGILLRVNATPSIIEIHQEVVKILDID